MDDNFDYDTLLGARGAAMAAEQQKEHTAMMLAQAQQRAALLTDRPRSPYYSPPPAADSGAGWRCCCGNGRGKRRRRRWHVALAKKADHRKIKAVLDARLAQYDKEHDDHEAKLKKMNEAQTKVRHDMHKRHQKARAALHADHLKSLGADPLHDHPRSK